MTTFFSGIDATLLLFVDKIAQRRDRGVKSDVFEIKGNKQVAKESDEPTETKPADETVGKSDQTSPQSHGVSDEILAKKPQCRSDRMASFNNQDDGRGEDSQPHPYATRQTQCCRVYP